VDNLPLFTCRRLFWATVYDPDQWLVTATMENSSNPPNSYDVYQHVVADAVKHWNTGQRHRLSPTPAMSAEAIPFCHNHYAASSLSTSQQ